MKACPVFSCRDMSVFVRAEPGWRDNRQSERPGADENGGRSESGVFEEATPTAPDRPNPTDSGDAADLSNPQGFQCLRRMALEDDAATRRIRSALEVESYL